MSKVQLLALSLVLAAGAAAFFQEPLMDAYLDYKSSDLAGKCYSVVDTRNGQNVGGLALQSYDSETNMFDGDGILDMGIIQLPFQLKVPREGIFQALESGELTETACQGE
jgi:hypothetical protein